MSPKNPVTSRTGRYPRAAMSWAPAQTGLRQPQSQMPQIAIPSPIPQPVQIPAPQGLEGIWENLPDEMKRVYAASWAASAPPPAPDLGNMDYMPHGPAEMFSGAGQMQVPSYIRGAGPGGYFLAHLAAAMNNALSTSGQRAYQTRIAGQQEQRQQKVNAYNQQVAERARMREDTFNAARNAASKPPEKVKPDTFYPVMQNDWNDMMKAGAIPQRIVDEYRKNNGALSKESFDSFQKAVDNLRSGQASDRATRALGDRLNPPQTSTDYSGDLSYSSTGSPFLNLGRFVGTARKDAETWARANGVRLLTKDEADAVDNVATARNNLRDLTIGLLPHLATGVGAKAGIASQVRGAENLVAGRVGADPFLKTFGTSRNAAIQSMRAAAGSKGLRINRAEINMSASNDVPQMNDTVASAVWRYQKMMTLLRNSEGQLMGQRPVKAPPKLVNGKIPKDYTPDPAILDDLGIKPEDWPKLSGTAPASLPAGWRVVR